MSNSLVRKSLELLGYEQSVKEGKKKKNRKQIKYKGTLDLIPPKHRILSKNDKTDLLTILGRSGRTTVYEVQKRLSVQENRTDKNAQKLLRLSKKCIGQQTANKLLERAVRKKHKPKPKKKKEEATAFTEEDFKKFEAEYVDE